ncbi:hypothetical protein [Dysgonomonas termitidis]
MAETDVTNTEKPAGRKGVLAKFMKANPGFEGEPTEEQLWDFAGNDYAGLKGTHKKVMSGQQGLHDYISGDPRFGAAIGMSFGEGEDKIPFNHALGRLYGPDAFSDDEDFIRGTQEYNQAQAQSRKEQEEAQENFRESLERFGQYVADNQLPEERKNAIYDGLMQLAESFLMGNIPTEIFELIDKGQTRDNDVEEAIATAEIEGRNQTIKAKMKEKTERPDGIVDMGSGTGPEAKEQDRQLFQPRPESVYDQLKEIKS